jgi:branched-subunit amino acid ABC-type transport system permease component
MIICAMLGVIAVYVSVRPVAKDRPLAPLISTIGLTIILQNLAVYIFGGQQILSSAGAGSQGDCGYAIGCGRFGFVYRPRSARQVARARPRLAPGDFHRDHP